MGNSQCLPPGNQDDFAADRPVGTGQAGRCVIGCRRNRVPQPALDAVAFDGITGPGGDRETCLQPVFVTAGMNAALKGTAFQRGSRRPPVCDETGAFPDGRQQPGISIGRGHRFFQQKARTGRALNLPAGSLPAAIVNAARRYALSRLRPRARRAAITLRPPAVAMRERNPWRRLRTSLLG